MTIQYFSIVKHWHLYTIYFLPLCDCILLLLALLLITIITDVFSQRKNNYDAEK